VLCTSVINRELYTSAITALEGLRQEVQEFKAKKKKKKMQYLYHSALL
jgi:hypothetical protein